MDLYEAEVESDQGQLLSACESDCKNTRQETQEGGILCECSCAWCKLVAMDDHHDRQEQQENANGAVLRLADIKGSLQMLQAVKSPAKQQATVIIEQSGLSIRWEDASKTLQSSIFLRTSIFSAFTLRGAKQMFGVHLGVLTDTLQVFVATGIELQLKYPGINSDLECQMQDQSGASSEFGGTPTEVNLTARVDSIEMQPLRDWADHWKEPHSYFLAPGAVLKEIIEDLEWAASSTNSCVRVRLTKDPQQLIFSGEGAGDLEIEVPVCDLNGFKCVETSVSHRYKYKHLKTALSNIPQRDPAAVNSKVLIDAEGMMKVTHMIQMPNLQHDNWGPMPSGHDSSQQTQGPKLGVIQCMLLNEGELGEGD